MKNFYSYILVFIFALAPAGAAFATPNYTGESEAPPSLEELQEIPRENILEIPENNLESALPYDIRFEAIKEAAVSYGARGGLAWRTYHIRLELDHRASYMDQVFDFNSLLIPAPSGLLIEPPVVSDAENAMIINGGGREAALADRVINITRNARIVSIGKSWRNYLEREWGDVTPPPDILRPNDKKERAKWREWVRQGWKQGIEQADEIFQFDLNQLVADYRGMVRYRMLLAQGMISPPYALQVYRGVTGGGNEMRVGDRAVEITGMPELVPSAEKWQPASR
jgi:defect-in-organelle-trafficking protein DotC